MEGKEQLEKLYKLQDKTFANCISELRDLKQAYGAYFDDVEYSFMIYTIGFILRTLRGEHDQADELLKKVLDLREKIKGVENEKRKNS